MWIVEKLLTIIIPVYGVEKYIQDFLDSLFIQNMEFVQCIFVNDGTKDNSLSILYKSIEIYDIECLVLNQENAGVSSARNNALKFATGKFITFLDPDDIVNPSYIDNILNIINTNNNISIIHYDAEVMALNGICNRMGFVEKTSTYIINEEYRLKNFRKHMWQPWLRVFKRDLLENFSFPEGYILEDVLSFPFIYKDGLNVYESFETLIIYRLNPTSLTAKKNEMFFSSMLYVIEFYRNLRHLKSFECIYLKLIESLYGVMLRQGFKLFYKFCSDFKLDIIYVKNNKHYKGVKGRFKYSKPILFYIYKTRFFLKRLK